MKDLSLQIIKDGEGLSKLIKVSIRNAKSKQQAKNIGFCIANSPLVKTAIAGEDANWGRVIAAIGKSEEKINQNTSAICAPDLMGNICDWEHLRSLADKYDLKIIHDSADTLGAKLNGKSTGSFSDVSITSFYGSHVINGAGNGGMIATSDKQLNEKMRLLRSWGRSSSLFQEDSESIENRFNVFLEGVQYDAKFVFEEIGYQLEPSEISAAFALIQYKKLKENIRLRQKIFEKHTLFFSKYSEYFVLPKENPDAENY